jgi:PTH2 family peptidyl-tRNA hydrolase
MTTYPKQVIVIRKDLKMRRGKEIAQGAHASMAWLSRTVREGFKTGNLDFTEAQRDWLSNRFTKICVVVNSEEELKEVYNNAKEAGITAHLIMDAGKTEFNEPTLTAAGIGPAYPEDIDKITGHLKLY